MSDNNYHSPFKRVHISPEGADLVKKLQRDFDKFWHSVKPQIAACHERAVALEKLQEACHWMTRALALNNRSALKRDLTPNHPSLENPAAVNNRTLRCEELAPQEQTEEDYSEQCLSEVLKELQGRANGVKNIPTVIFRKKKEA